MVDQKKPAGMSYVVGSAQVGSPGLTQIPPRSANMSCVVGAAQVGAPGLSQIPPQPKIE